jgi:hypothetical protein
VNDFSSRWPHVAFIYILITIYLTVFEYTGLIHG